MRRGSEARHPSLVLLHHATLIFRLLVQGAHPSSHAIMWRVLVSTLFALALLRGAFADLYVNPTGTDSGTCEAFSPCESLQRASEIAQPGETIEVSSGTYDPVLLHHPVRYTLRLRRPLPLSFFLSHSLLSLPLVPLSLLYRSPSPSSLVLLIPLASVNQCALLHLSLISHKWPSCSLSSLISHLLSCSGPWSLLAHLQHFH